MFGRAQARPGGIVRPGPAFPVVVQVAEYVEVLLPAGRAGVERLAARKLQARDDEVQLMVVGMAMPDPEDVALVRLQTCKGHGLEVVHDARFLLRRHPIIRMPGQHPGRELPFGVQGVDQFARRLRIAAQHLGRAFVPMRVVQAHEVARRRVPAALAVRKDFHVHKVTTEGFDSREGRASRGSLFSGAAYRLSTLSRLKRAARTCRASARRL